jgi:dihydroorotase
MKTSTKFSRRRFLKLAAIAAAGTLRSKETQALGQMPSSYDILIRGGDVIDPGQALHGKRDIAVHGGRIVRVEPEITNISATLIIDAKGKLVVPGLIDLHGHIGLKGGNLGLPVDDIMEFTGVTTCVSAGDKGYPDFEGFRSNVLDRMKTRTFAFLNISRLGLKKWPEPELLDINRKGWAEGTCNVSHRQSAGRVI